MPREKKIDMVILGLLSHEPLTGYDMKKRIDGAIRFFWNGSFGNIYPSLKELENNGSITRCEVTSDGREKISYKITASGKEELRKWLRDEQASNELKYETLLKLFFGGVEEKNVTYHNIEVFENKIRGDLEMLRAYGKVLEKDLENEDHLHYYLTVSFGIDCYEAYLKWCAKAKQLLNRRAQR